MTAARRILVVDDSNDNREAIGALLRFMAYDVRVAGSGDEALAIAADFGPELFLIDVKMPGMTGLQLLEKLDVAAGKPYEAIMMTGHESVDDACKAMELGAVSYLRKPVRYEELAKYIGEALGRVDERAAIEQRRISLEREVTRHTRKAEESFKAAEFQSRRFDLILDNMQEPLLAIDAGKRVMMINRAAERAFDISAGEALERTIGEAFTGTALGRSIDRINDDFISESDTASTGFLEYAGRRYAVSVSRLVQHDGSKAGYVMIFTDKTSQYRTEQLQTMFLSVVSHEFKTPLSILMNAAAMLDIRRHCSDEVEAVKTTIDETCLRLTRLVNAVVTFARINRDDVQLTTAPIDIYYMLALSIGKFSDVARKKEVAFFLTSTSGPRNAATDGELLTAAVDCILDNAVKYSPERGKIEIGYQLTAREEGKLLHIVISDEGPGIPPDKIDTVFEWFGQGEDPLRRKSGGLGLGLPLARRAVEMLGGKITVRTGPQGGCIGEIVTPVR